MIVLNPSEYVGLKLIVPSRFFLLYNCFFPIVKNHTEEMALIVFMYVCVCVVAIPWENIRLNVSVAKLPRLLTSQREFSLWKLYACRAYVNVSGKITWKWKKKLYRKLQVSVVKLQRKTYICICNTRWPFWHLQRGSKSFYIATIKNQHSTTNKWFWL